MQNNQPVTNEEYHIPQSLTLVTKTDLHGNITELNDAFEIASGFSREELLGHSHNIVRHPDVPETIFKDMWKTLKMGATWSQVVKNRRKDGSFYWVRANASPIFKDGKIIGYISYRVAITETEKLAAAQSYQDLKSGRKKIQYGKIYSGINWSELNLYGKLNPQWQLLTLSIIFGVIPLFVIGIREGLHLALIIFLAFAMITPAFIHGLSQLHTQNAVRAALRRVAANEPIQMSCSRPNHFIGKLINPVISASIAIRHAFEDIHAKADEAAKLQTAVDQVSSN